MHARTTTSEAHGSRQATMMGIARATAVEYEKDPRVRTIILVGSLAHGKVDRVSDIDMMLYIDEYFTEKEVAHEQERARSSGGGIYGANPDHGFGVWRCVEGVKVDLAFNMIPNMESLLDEVLEKHTLENDMHLIVDGIGRSKVLYDDDLVSGWKDRIDAFPHELGTKMIREHLRVTPLWIARDMCAKRGEQIWFAELILEYLRRGLWILCGINGRYFPGKMKGFESNAATLAIAPEDYVRRVHHLFSAEPRRAVEALHELILDIYDLVDRYRPEIGTEEARTWFLAPAPCTGK